jgi:23S rRNA pseudouridine2605 synthase
MRERPPRAGRQRLQKILAAAGIASRRAAEELLREGRVRVNGRTASLGDSADPARDAIAVDGERVRAEPLRYWMLHKPRGVVTTARDPEGRPSVLDLVPEARVRLFPVGRLDRETEGLVLLTNDGALAHALLHPSLESEREYRMRVRGRVSEATRLRLERGVPLAEGRTAPARAVVLGFDPEADATRLGLTLVEGRKRQIRRALRALGHPVRRLVRVRMGPLRLGRLARGEARPLRPEEVRALRAHAERLRARAGRARRRRPPSHPRARAAARRDPRGAGAAGGPARAPAGRRGPEAECAAPQWVPKAAGPAASEAECSPRRQVTRSGSPS